VAEVTVFDIQTILVDLLCNEDLIKREHLVFGENDFTDIDDGLTNPDVYDDVNTGYWWKETATKIKEDYPDIEQRSILWPLILLIDGVSHGEFTNLNQEPILMSFSAFKHRDKRNKAQAWRPLAYVDYKGNLKGKVTPVMALNEYHEVLGTVFAALKDVQSTCMNWTLTLPKEETKDVVLFFPVQFIIGDCEGHDKLCGRFKSHHDTPRQVRDCDIPTQLADEIEHVCHFYTKDEMSRFDNEELKLRSFHRILFPCHDGMDFGASQYGIHGAAMPENHHAYLGGARKEVGVLFPNSLSNTSLTHTDKVMA
jgi:hypothetical protein